MAAMVEASLEDGDVAAYSVFVRGAFQAGEGGNLAMATGVDVGDGRAHVCERFRELVLLFLESYLDCGTY